MRHFTRFWLLFMLAVPGVGQVFAKPFTPESDSVVLERLPEKTDPSLSELKRLRIAVASNPHNVEIATHVARRAIEASRATGDPRFLGQAQAALSPWWNVAEPPVPVLVLRATIKQSQHDFAGALADLDRLLAARPADGQGLLTRATIHTVQGRYANAQNDCAKLARVASGLVTMTCMAGASSLSGDAAGAYGGLTRALAQTEERGSTRVWALTLAAEIAARRGDAAAADAQFNAALAIDTRDGYLSAAYADHLLDTGRSADVVRLLANDTKNDSLLLRLALAESTLPDRHVEFNDHRRELALRFAAAKRRGDTLHLREEARFQLEVERDPQAALALAHANWKSQREPADLYLLAAAGRAVGDAMALRTVSEWLASTRLEYPAVAALVAGGAR